jgi:2-polyprenyl-6-methoxyphenol hydroxylase-like FAD-dependent oxidoreductase
MGNALTAIIAGGGLGGLATAAALARTGWGVTVYERQNELRATGSGIYIWENGLKVLEALGACDKASDGAFQGTHFEQRDNQNQIIESAAIPAGRRLITTERSQLLASLRDAALDAGARIMTGTEVIGATPRGELQFSSGATARADLAIGADGVWSKVRQALGLEQVHEQSLEGALRTMIPAMKDDIPAADASKYIENWNGTRRLLITPVNDRVTYLALTCPSTDLKAKSTSVDKGLWSAAFPQWAHLIERIGREVSWGVYSVIKCRAWSSGRTVILGDAAHAQPPNLGQGGGMAMQNGLALATALRGTTTQQQIPDALEKWEQEEREIVEHCQKWSTLYGEVTFLPDDVRTTVIKSAMANPWVANQIFRAANHIPTGFEAFAASTTS